MTEPRPGPSAAVDRARALFCCVAITAAMLAQQPGRLVGDTKLDLVVDPWRFMERSLHLWTPQAYFGGVQNQAYGYLFPMGPFFGIGQSIGLPGWVVQRLWQALLLCVAFLGMRLLSRRMGIGTPLTRLLGSLVFALCPLILAKIGPISSEALPECLAPWVLAPLVGEAARQRPRRAAAASGVAVLCAGGVNAAATLAMLVIPALWLVTRRPGPDRRRLVRWWVVSVVAASLWWAVGLAAIARTAAPFLNWIETSSTTTATTSLFDTLTGGSAWLAHLPLSLGSTWSAGHQLVTTPLILADAAAVVAFGLAGLLVRDVPHRRFLLLSLLAGVFMVGAGWVGPSGPPLADTARGLLDGTLVAFRNISKLDPVLRLPLVLGLIHAATRVTWQRYRSPDPVPGLAAVPPIAGLTVLALVGLTMPMWRQNVEPAGSFDPIPRWWTQTARWLQSHGEPTQRALLLPAAAHPDYVWGRPTDEPLQALTTTDWGTRDVVPLGGAGEARMLDAVDAQLQSGQGSEALAPYLARAGVSWLVVRNDLDPTAQPVTPPATVDAALQASPGLTPVTGFGPRLTIGVGDATVPTVEVWRVAGSGAPAEMMPADSSLQVSGGPESLLQLLQQHLVGTHTATVMTAQGPGPRPLPRAVVTDGYRRRAADFADVINNYSATLARHQPFVSKRPEQDYRFAPTAGHQTVASITGVRSVSASSSADQPGAFFVRGASHSALSAFDHDPATAWISGGGQAVGEWVQETFDGRPDVPSVQIGVPSSAPGAPVRTVTVSTQQGRVRVRLPAPGGMAGVRLPAGPTGWLRVTVDAVAGGGPGTVASLEVTAAGVPAARRFLVVPDDARSPVAAYSFHSAAPTGTGCLRSLRDLVVCSPNFVDQPEDASGIDREFSVRGTGEFDITATATPRGGAAVDQVLQQDRFVQLAASSQLVADPGDGAVAMIDGDRGSAWTASADDPDPRVTVTLLRRMPVTAVRIDVPHDLPVSAPTRVRIATLAGAHRTARLVDGVARLPRPLTGSVFSLSFPSVATRISQVGQDVRKDPVGIAELRLRVRPVGRSAHRSASQEVPSPVDPFAPLPAGCGDGPPLLLDGQALPTEMTGTVGDLLSDRQVGLRPCGPSVAGGLTLDTGSHRLQWDADTDLAPDSVTVRAAGARFDAASPARQLGIGDWASDSRTVRVGPGAAGWLVVHENYNVGWQAELNGHRLAAATVDGWQQAFLLPGGAGGVVHLTYGPQRSYRTGLLAGALAVLVLLALWLTPERSRAAQPLGRRRLAWVAAVVAPAVMVLLGGAAGVAAFAAAAVATLLARRARLPWLPPALAGLAVAAAGGVAAWAARLPAGLPSDQVAVVQDLSLLGVAFTAVALAAPSVARLERVVTLRHRHRQEPVAVATRAPAIPRGTATGTPPRR